jgi:hypothetical protein
LGKPRILKGYDVGYMNNSQIKGMGKEYGRMMVKLLVVCSVLVNDQT